MQSQPKVMSSKFQIIQPLCVQIAQKPSRDKVAMLCEVLRTFDRPTMQTLQEYTLFPLRLVFQQPTKCGDDLRMDSFSCMIIVLSQSQLTKWDVFQDLFSMASIQLSSPADKGRVAVIPEELKLEIIHFLRALLKSAVFSVLEKLYGAESLPVLGHLVSVLLNVADTENSQPLKIASMECLLDLSGANTKYCQTVRCRLGDTFASFLPGISITLGRIITADIKQGQAVTITALEVWYSVVKLVMEDCQLEKLQATEKSNHNVTVSEKLQELIVRRTSSWVDQTSSKLSVIITHISTIRGHSKWKVRACLVEWASCLLNNCSKSLKGSVPTILEILVGLVNDEYPRVASKSRDVVEQFSSTSTGANQRPLVEILEENLHGLSLSLPRFVRATDEDEKLGHIQLLAGYLTLLGPNMKSLLVSLPHLKRLSLALVQALELDCTDIKIVEEKNQFSGQGAASFEKLGRHDIIKPRKYFKHIHSEVLIQELQNVCRLLGYYGNLHILTDQFLNMFCDCTHKMAATLILNEIMLGAAGMEVSIPINKTDRSHHEVEDLENVVRMLLDEYLCLDNMDLLTRPASVQKTSERGSVAVLRQISSTRQKATLRNINQNILHICLYLEGIGSFSKVLGKSFRPFLIDVLYPLMEKLGDEIAYISNTAYLTLCDICITCDYRSLGDLIQDNMDYIMNAISLRLRHFEHKRRCPLVLKVILQYSDACVLTVIEDTTNEILLCMDEYYGDEAVLFMDVFNELAKGVTRWFNLQKVEELDEQLCEKKDDQRKTLQSSVEEIKEFYLSYHKQKQIAEFFMEDIDTEPDVEQPDLSTDHTYVDSAEEEKQIPKHITIMKEVMLRCKHLLSSHNPRLQLKVLDTVSFCARALHSHQDELLPLVHELWQPFSHRFVDEEKLVIIKAMETLAVLAEVSGDFIKRRTMKDVFPKVSQFLKKQGLISVSTGPAYLHTVIYKLQLSFLGHIGHVAKKIGAEENDADMVATACLPYLSARQPSLLQKAAVNAFHVLIELEPDSMWLKLNHLYSPTEYTNSRSIFPTIKMSEGIGIRNEYTDNVMELLKSNRLFCPILK